MQRCWAARNKLPRGCGVPRHCCTAPAPSSDTQGGSLSIHSFAQKAQSRCKLLTCSTRVSLAVHLFVRCGPASSAAADGAGVSMLGAPGALGSAPSCGPGWRRRCQRQQVYSELHSRKSDGGWREVRDAAPGPVWWAGRCRTSSHTRAALATLGADARILLVMIHLLMGQ
jgi:hypothetical protein